MGAFILLYVSLNNLIRISLHRFHQPLHENSEKRAQQSKTWGAHSGAPYDSSLPRFYTGVNSMAQQFKKNGLPGPEEDTTFLRNVGTYLPDDTASDRKDINLQGRNP